MTNKTITVSIAQQMLFAFEAHQLVARYPISSAKNGVGQQQGSGCTPLGGHRVCAKVGEGASINSVFVARQATGELYSPMLAAKHPQRDWILSRVIRLQGTQLGFNLGVNPLGCCDSMARYIYIHGAPDELPMRVPLSHGCIRMRNTDVIALFAWVDLHTPVYIYN